MEQRGYTSIKKFSQFKETLGKSEGNLVVLLDQIIDPFNLASIIRSSFYYGVNKIILNKLNSPPISPAVARVSLGASECAELYSLKFVQNFLEDARTNGWKVVSTGIIPNDAQKTEKKEKSSVELQDLAFKPNDNVIVIFGSEDKGVTQNFYKFSDYVLSIPPLHQKEMIGKYPFSIIDSLNVGVTAGIILNHVMSQLKDENKINQKLVNNNI